MKSNFKRALRSVAAPALTNFGYELIDLKESVGSRSFFFRKKLWGDMFSFIDFHLMEWASIPNENNLSPRKFSVRLWRNRGEKPRLMYAKNDTAVDDWLYMSLSYLIWDILNIKVYGSPYHEWEFTSSDELNLQLQNAINSIKEYGIAWLENPDTRCI